MFMQWAPEVQGAPVEKQHRKIKLDSRSIHAVAVTYGKRPIGLKALHCQRHSNARCVFTALPSFSPYSMHTKNSSDVSSEKKKRFVEN